MDRGLDRLGQGRSADLLHRQCGGRNAGQMQAMRVVELIQDQRQQHLRHAGAQRLRRGAGAAVMHHHGDAGKERSVRRTAHAAPSRRQRARAQPGPAGIEQTTAPTGCQRLDQNALDAVCALARHAAKADVHRWLAGSEPGVELRVEWRRIVKEDGAHIRVAPLPLRVGRKQFFICGDDDRASFKQVVPQVRLGRQTQAGTHAVDAAAQQQVDHQVVDVPEQGVDPARQAVPRNIGRRVLVRGQNTVAVQHAQLGQTQVLGNTGCAQRKPAPHDGVGAAADRHQLLCLQGDLSLEVTVDDAKHLQRPSRHDVPVLRKKGLDVLA